MATETELERLLVRVLGDASSYVTMMKQVEKSNEEAVEKIQQAVGTIEGLKGQLEGFASSAQSFLAKVGVGLGAWAAFKKFEESDMAVTRLKGAIEASGRAVGPAIEQYKAFAKEIAATTMATKGQVYEILKSAEAYGLHNEDAQRAVKSALALKEAVGGETSQWVRAIAMAEKGEQFMLRRMLRIHHVTDSEKIMEELHKKVAIGESILEAQTKTSAFAFNQMQKAAGALTTQLGGTLAIGIRPVVGALRDLITAFNELSPAVRNTIVYFLALSAAIKPAVYLGGLIAAAWAGLTAKLLKVGAAWGTVMNVLQLSVTAFGGWAMLLAGGVVAAAAAAAYGVYKLTQAFTTNTEAARLNNQAVEATKRANQKFAELQGKKVEDVVSEAGGREDMEDRKKFLEQAVKDQQDEVKRINSLVEQQQQRVEGIKDSYILPFRVVNPERKQAQEQLEGLKAQLDAAKDAGAKMREELDKVKPPEQDKKVYEEWGKVIANLNFETEHLAGTFSDLEVEIYKHQSNKFSDKMNEEIANAVRLNWAVKGTAKATEELNKAVEDLSIGIAVANNEITELDAAVKKLQKDSYTEAQNKYIEALKREEDAAKKTREAFDDFNQAMGDLQIEAAVAAHEITELDAEVMKLQKDVYTEEQNKAIEAQKRLTDAIKKTEEATGQFNEAMGDMQLDAAEAAYEITELDKAVMKLQKDVYSAEQNKALEAQKRLTEAAKKTREAFDEFNDTINSSSLEIAQLSGAISEVDLGALKTQKDAFTVSQNKAVEAIYREKYAWEQVRKIVEEARSTEKQFATPQEKFVDRVNELNRQLEYGGLSFNVYAKAINSAAGEMVKANEAAQELQGTAYGSAAAVAKISSYVGTFTSRITQFGGLTLPTPTPSGTGFPTPPRIYSSTPALRTGPSALEAPREATQMQILKVLGEIRDRVGKGTSGGGLLDSVFKQFYEAASLDDLGGGGDF